MVIGRSPELRIKCFQRDKYTCVKCGFIGKEGHYQDFGGMKINLIADHIIPLSLGGKDKLDNMQTLCLKCNKKKNKKDQSDIARKKRKLKNERN